MLNVSTFFVFTMKLILQRGDPCKLFVYFAHSDIWTLWLDCGAQLVGRARPRSSLRPTRREIMFSFFAVLIYSAQPRKLKLKGLHADVKRHFCSTINLNYLMFYTLGQRDFLTMYLNSIWHLWPLTFFLTLLRPRIDKFNFYRQHRHSKITSKCCFDTMRLYEMGIKFRMLRM